MKKAIVIILCSLLAVILFIGVGAWTQFGPFVKSAMSIRQMGEGLYYMEYEGDDGLDGLLERGGCTTADELTSYIVSFLTGGHYSPADTTEASMDYGCSAICVRTPEDSVLMGRNFDFTSATGIILHTIPQKGYETYTTFNLKFLGWEPDCFANKYMSLAGLFLALDGINEKGLAIADLMAGDSVQTHQQTDKIDFTTTSAIVYMLRNAADVEEALTLLTSIDMHSDIGMAHHYAMADATGRSVVVEYVDNEMVVVEAKAVANHYLCEQKLNAGHIEGDDRYDILCNQLASTDSIMSREVLTQTAQSVTQPAKDNFLGTAWTMIMNLTKPSVTYYSRRNFDTPFHFDFSQKGR